MRPIVLLSALLLVGCGTSKPTSSASSGPVPVNGFTVEAPTGEGWRIADQDDDSVVFERRLGDDGHVLTAMAALFPFEFHDLEECRASLHRDSYVETATHRSPRGSVRVVEGAKPPYVLVRYGAEEADGPGPGASWFTLTSEFRWYLRPGDGRGVMLSFSERRPRDSKPAEYGAQATLFFQSLRFAEPEQRR